jgi:hypothetical protein
LTLEQARRGGFLSRDLAAARFRLLIRASWDESSLGFTTNNRNYHNTGSEGNLRLQEGVSDCAATEAFRFRSDRKRCIRGENGNRSCLGHPHGLRTEIIEKRTDLR